MLVLFIKKKNSFLKLVQDYRVLNIMIIKNKYLLPLISKLVTKLQDVYYFTKLNVCWRFNNVHIKSSDKWKIVFYINYNIFTSLMIITKHKLFLHPEKCKFDEWWIKYLGLVILEDQVKIDFIKIARIQNWPTLKNCNKLQDFLGFINFY